ncbi:MAG: hypothetical protein L0170_01835 [Acidobacteria bacterium]|nr:hypothetical protein [Acidobacteriota bacterium]
MGRRRASREIFSIEVVRVLVTTLITSLWLRSAFPRRPAASAEGDRVFESFS